MVEQVGNRVIRGRSSERLDEDIDRAATRQSNADPKLIANPVRHESRSTRVHCLECMEGDIPFDAPAADGANELLVAADQELRALAPRR